MKNKHVKQMMIDCGNDELLLKLTQQKIASRCQTMIHRIPRIDIHNPCIKIFNEYDHLFSEVTADEATYGG